jgi:hypothetical protein
MRPVLPFLAMALLLPCVPPSAAQTLASRPALFGDPVPGVDPSVGELVLGSTTLTSALRIFAVELEDTVVTTLRHGSNPALLSTTELFIGGVTIRPSYRLDLGSDRYTLYFDKNERLIAAMGAPPRRPLRRDELVARYATLKVQQRGRTAEGTPVYDGLEAPLGPCVSLTAGVWLQRNVVEGLGYVYTCSTKPSIQKARLDWGP